MNYEIQNIKYKNRHAILIKYKIVGNKCGWMVLQHAIPIKYKIDTSASTAGVYNVNYILYALHAIQ
jgi:hypothetical protein